MEERRAGQCTSGGQADRRTGSAAAVVVVAGAIWVLGALAGAGRSGWATGGGPDDRAGEC